MTKTNHRCKLDVPETIPTEDRILSFLGLATRAGKTISGTDASVLAVSSGAAFLVIVSEDASEKTAEKFAYYSKINEVPYCRFSTMENLGKFLGKRDRAVAIIMDQGFASQLIQMLLYEHQVVCTYGDKMDHQEKDLGGLND